MKKTSLFLISSTGFLAGAYTCQLLISAYKVNPVFASCLVGAAASLIFYRKKTELQHAQMMIFCGSFAGMSQPSFFTNDLVYLFISLLAGLVSLLAKETFNGYGGKFGTIAFISVFLTSLFL